MISLRFMLQQLEPYVVATTRAKGWESRPYEVGFMGLGKRLRSDTLYIAQANALVTEGVVVDPGAAIIVCNATEETLSKMPESASVIAVSCRSATVYDVIDRALSASRQIDTSIRDLSDEGRATYDILEAIAKKTGVDIVVTDTDGKATHLLLKGAPGFFNSCISEKGMLPLAKLKDMLPYIYAPVGDSCPIPDKDDCLYGHLIGSVANPKGYVFMVGPERGHDYLAICAKTSGFMNRRLASTSERNGDLSAERFGDLWSVVINRELTTANEIRELFTKAPSPVKEFASIGLIHFNGNGSEVPYNYVLSRLRSLVPGTNFTIFKGDIVALFSEDPRNERFRFKERERINEFLAEQDARMFVSSAAKRLEGLFSIYYITKRTSLLVNALGVVDDAERIVYSEDYNSYCVIDFALRNYLSVEGNKDIVFLTHPGTVVLTRYDREHHSNLRDTLFEYLMNDCNLLRTSEHLHMHRNTVLNKVNKIKELTQIDFDNPKLRQKLVLSCQILRYCEKILGRTIQ